MPDLDQIKQGEQGVRDRCGRFAKGRSGNPAGRPRGCQTCQSRRPAVWRSPAIPEIRARGGGALLYTGSTSGIQGSAFSPVYSMAKFGVVGFVRSLAKRLAPEKIRVNAVCPGPIDTPMLRIFVARLDQQRTAGQDKEELV